jgi:hypothetical protein
MQKGKRVKVTKSVKMRSDASNLRNNNNMISNTGNRTGRIIMLI